ncbi:Vitamin B12 transporter BtuB [Alphaproteobacteria bacterium SO-S41]|nr:Vitamin B12 transporter BtuB [Alphaproteobacteria bacterium SO-S41]
MSVLKSRAWVRVLLSSVALGSVAEAQVEWPAAGASKTSETVVVTGQRVPAGRTTSPAPRETVTAAEAAERINVVNTEDILKYLPSIFVRKRHIGDIQDPITTRTSGVGQSARSLIFADGILLSSLIGNNNSAASPHWGMVAPEDIAKVDVMYGPFGAAYAGNSVGAVVEITTRMPDRLEVDGKTLAGFQSFSQYGTSGTYDAYQVSAGLGDRSGAFAWRLSLNHVGSHSQPLAYVTLARPVAPTSVGTVVTGAFAGINRTGAPIAIIGAGGFEHQQQDTATLKLTYDLTPHWRVAYTASLFVQDNDAEAETYLRSASGAPVYAGAVNIGGYAYTIAASAFSNNVYRLDQKHLAQALSLTGEGDGDWDWSFIATRYDYLDDEQRTPSVALPSASAGGAGTLARYSGTGWTTLDAKAVWRASDALAVSFGLHRDAVSLDLKRFTTADWVGGPAGALASEARGQTETKAAWVQGVWEVAPAVTATLGLRIEDWRASDGYNYSLSPALAVTQPEVSGTFSSPKASLAWRPDDAWTVTASWGVAYRMPTVTELYQTITTGAVLTVPNPNLRPEHANSYDLSVAYARGEGRVRLSLFAEDLDDALISQSAPLVPGSTTLFSYVQNIDEVRSRGVEAVFDWNNVLIDGLQLSGAVTYVDSEIVSDPAFRAAEGKRTPQIPRWRATLAATWRPTEALSLTLAGRYGDRSYGTIDNSDVVSDTYQGFDDYFVVDARVRYQLNEHWSASVGVDNLNDDRSFIFHPFPQRTVLFDLHYSG